MEKKRFFILKIDFIHPFMKYHKGTVKSGLSWAYTLGHSMDEKEFHQYFDNDKRFKKYFEELIN